MNNTQINFAELKLLDMDGVLVKTEQPFHKLIANILYQNVTNLDLVEVARDINKGAKVWLAPAEAEEIKKILLAPTSGIAAFAKLAIEEFMDDSVMIGSGKRETARKPREPLE